MTMEKQEKTKYKLAASVKECMKNTPVDKITVKDIVEAGTPLKGECVVWPDRHFTGIFWTNMT